jgi:hypothetical protein
LINVWKIAYTKERTSSKNCGQGVERNRYQCFSLDNLEQKKATAVKVTQMFCFEFCQAVGILWSNSTFLFTAFPGSAAFLFGGVTICKHVYLQRSEVLTGKIHLCVTRC